MFRVAPPARTFVSALASYDPDVSIGKLRAASLFTIVYLVAENVTTRRTLRLLVFTLIASCMINVVYTFGQRISGRGMKVTEEGDFARAEALYPLGD